jgi:hypothetical protein
MSSRFPRPKVSLAVAGDQTDFAPTPTAEVLEDARKRWGLDAAPTATHHKKQEQRELRRALEEQAIVLHGTPLDYARSLMHRDIPQPWLDALRAISPKTDATAWLELAWKQPPGQPAKARLVIYECVPDHLIPTGMRMMLSDTPYWEKPKEQRKGRESFVSAYQWEMYRLHRVWARPFWCLQGDTGGTPMQYTELEQKMLRLAQQPTTPPGLGALKFAPWDGRVEYALRQRDRLRKVNGSLDRLRAEGGDPAVIQAELDMAEKEFRRALFKWWGEQMAEASEFLAWYESKCESDHTLRRASRAEFLASERLEESYIEHGVIPVVRPYED